MTAAIKTWDRAAIVELLMSNDNAVVRAIKTLYARQTADEQSTSDTKHRNGVGFNSRDARFLSDVAKKLPLYHDRMTRRQIEVARKMLPKYWRQLLEVVEEKGGVVDWGTKSRKGEIVPDEVPTVDPAFDEVEMDAEVVALAAADRVDTELWGRF